jgi:MoxR-like ATPase
MNPVKSVTPSQLTEFLLNVAVVRPVFIWGPPGIGKSSLVTQFAEQLGLPCVSLLGSQLAPEDLIGVPQIDGGVSRFCPPAQIARSEPYCLFLDELNACSHEVQKAFYSLIQERRIGEYHLQAGSIVIGAGNRAQDSAIVKPMASALPPPPRLRARPDPREAGAVESRDLAAALRPAMGGLWTISTASA